MRYESFYPFSQGQNQPSEQPVSRPSQSGFFNTPNPSQYNQEIPYTITSPSSQRRFPFGLGNRGGQNQVPVGRVGTENPNQPFGFNGGGPNQFPFGLGGGQQQPPQQPPSKMEQYLQTADRFLTTAQQFQPMVNKVAPMVQNIPALWKLYRGFQSVPSAGAAAGAAGAAASAASQTGSRAAASAISSGISQPRIFQPPF